MAVGRVDLGFIKKRCAVAQWGIQVIWLCRPDPDHGASCRPDDTFGSSLSLWLLELLCWLRSETQVLNITVTHTFLTPSPLIPCY